MNEDDDRSQFEVARLQWGAELSKDDELLQSDLALTAAADRHNYSYMWSWLGLPVIQMPTDVVAAQELLWRNRPQVVIETGIARGGSLILYASILELIGEGRVIGIDIDIRPHNRVAIEGHAMSERIHMIEGSSVDPNVVSQVKEELGGSDRIMVVLDSDHTHAHVLQELRHYGPLVSIGQSLVVADTIVETIPPQKHRPRPWGPGNNPMTAVSSYLRECDLFEMDPSMNNKLLMSSSRGGYLRRVR